MERNANQKAKFILTLLIGIFLLFSLAGATTYYVKNGGDDGKDGLSDANAWETIAKVETSAGNGDTVRFKKGSIWRDQLDVPAANMTFEAYGSGDKSKIYGSAQVSTWENESGSLWYASNGSDPQSVWFVNTDTTITWGKKEANKVDLTAEYEWWWDSGNSRIYVYAATDPDSRYTSIEIPARDYCIYVLIKDNITIDGFELCFNHTVAASNYAAIAIYKSASPHIENCTIHHSGVLSATPQGNGINIEDSSNAYVGYNTIYHCARRAIIIKITTADYSASNAIIEHNICSNIHHAGINVFRDNVSGSVDNVKIRYNYIYLDSNHNQGESSDLTKAGIYIGGPVAASSYRVTNIDIYYNIVRKMYKDSHIALDRKIDGAEVYNNVTYGTMTGAVSAPGIDVRSDNNSNIVIKNNIGMDCSAGASGSGCLTVADSTDVTACDNNCWHQSAGGTHVYARIDGSSYHFDDFAAYKAATGWDTNGLWEDPLVVDPANGNFSLQSSSPCIDAGIGVGLTQDYAGITVPQGSAPDIGAYEYEQAELNIIAIDESGRVIIIKQNEILRTIGRMLIMKDGRILIRIR